LLDRVKEIQKQLKDDPNFQESIKKIKPKRSIFGFLAIILFFFVPEYLSYFYSEQINNYILDLAKEAPSTKLGDTLVWLSQKQFNGKISYINISLGVAFLIWLFKGSSSK